MTLKELEEYNGRLLEKAISIAKDVNRKVEPPLIELTDDKGNRQAIVTPAGHLVSSPQARNAPVECGIERLHGQLSIEVTNENG